MVAFHWKACTARGHRARLRAARRVGEASLAGATWGEGSGPTAGSAGRGVRCAAWPRPLLSPSPPSGGLLGGRGHSPPAGSLAWRRNCRGRGGRAEVLGSHLCPAASGPALSGAASAPPPPGPASAPPLQARRRSAPALLLSVPWSVAAVLWAGLGAAVQAKRRGCCGWWCRRSPETVLDAVSLFSSLYIHLQAGRFTTQRLREGPISLVANLALDSSVDPCLCPSVCICSFVFYHLLALGFSPTPPVFIAFHTLCRTPPPPIGGRACPHPRSRRAAAVHAPEHVQWPAQPPAP